MGLRTAIRTATHEQVRSCDGARTAVFYDAERVSFRYAVDGPRHVQSDTACAVQGGGGPCVLSGRCRGHAVRPFGHSGELCAGTVSHGHLPWIQRASKTMYPVFTTVQCPKNSKTLPTEASRFASLALQNLQKCFGLVRATVGGGGRGVNVPS
jgi:hypothetical protein